MLAQNLSSSALRLARAASTRRCFASRGPRGGGAAAAAAGCAFGASLFTPAVACVLSSIAKPACTTACCRCPSSALSRCCASSRSPFSKPTKPGAAPTPGAAVAVPRPSSCAARSRELARAGPHKTAGRRGRTCPALRGLHRTCASSCTPGAPPGAGAGLLASVSRSLTGETKRSVPEISSAASSHPDMAQVRKGARACGART